jgi:hypothetical protein
METVECPLCKLVSISDVFTTVNKYQRLLSVMGVENTFQMILGFFKELGPLSLKELKALCMDGVRMISFESLGNGGSFMEVGVVDHSCYGYFGGHFCFILIKD